MPRPRFEKLSAEKRERILEAAGREFAAEGYEKASMNQILSNAGISKGAAYYYFDDKLDLFMTAVTYYTGDLMHELAFDINNLNQDTYWPTLSKLYRQQFELARRQPWVFSLFKNASAFSAQSLEQENMTSFDQDLQTMISTLLIHGQALGLVRRDLHIDLLAALVISLDQAHDQWLLSQWPEMQETEVESAVARIINLLQRLLAPEI